MALDPPDPTRSDTAGAYLLLLRSRARLTQTELAAQLGIHRRSVQKWESGETYPTAERVRDLIVLLLARGGFTPGQEGAEATTLWQRVRQATGQARPLFDAPWFARVLATRPTPEGPDPAAAEPAVAGGPRVDWGEALAVPTF